MGNQEGCQARMASRDQARSIKAPASRVSRYEAVDGEEETSMKLYAKRDPMALEPHFTRHMLAMTVEDLHEKGDIALELAWRQTRSA